MAQADAEEHLNWAVSVDPTSVRAHQHAAGARKKESQPTNPTTTPSAGDRADYGSVDALITLVEDSSKILGDWGEIIVQAKAPSMSIDPAPTD